MPVHVVGIYEISLRVRYVRAGIVPGSVSLIRGEDLVWVGVPSLSPSGVTVLVSEWATPAPMKDRDVADAIKTQLRPPIIERFHQ